MPKTIKELRSQRDALAREARNIVDAETGDYDAERVDEILAEVDRIDTQIDQQKRLLDVEAQAEIDATDPDTPAPQGRRAPEGRPGDEVRTQVFEAFLRGGERAVERLPENILSEYGRQVSNAQSTGTDAEGGALVPTTFATTLLEAMAAFGGTRQVADVIDTGDGSTIQWPTVDETSEEGEWLEENDPVGATDGDMSFGTKTIGAHLASSRVVTIPYALLQDSFLGDIEATVRRFLAARLARTTNKAYTVGDGNGKPEGWVVGAAVGHTTAAGLTTSYGVTDLIDLEHSVDPLYRANGSWQMHDSALKVAKKMLDTQGRPIWMPGISGEAPAEILGYGYTVNQDMATPAANSKSIGFGDFKKYLIRDVMDVTLFRFTDSVYTKKGQVAFLCMLRTDGATIHADNTAFKVMQQAAA